MIIFFLNFNKIERVVIFILFIFLETCGDLYWVYIVFLNKKKFIVH